MNPFKPAHTAGSFLPEDYIKRKAEMRASIMTLGLFGIVMFCVVAAFFVTNRQWLTVRAEQEAINVLYTQEAQKIDQLKSLEEQKAQMMDKAEITTALLERVPRSVLLAEIVTRMPRSVVLVEMELMSKRIEDTPGAQNSSKGPARVGNLSSSTAGKAKARPAGARGRNAPPETKEEAKPKVRPPKFEYTLTLVGLAAANGEIADYLSALKACPLLERVDLQFIQATTINSTDLRKFRIDAQIRKDADARAIAPPAELTQGQPPTAAHITDKPATATAGQAPAEQE